MVAIAGHLHQPVDAVVVRWEAALSISVAIAAAEMGVRLLRHALPQDCQNLFDLVGALHTHLARLIVKIILKPSLMKTLIKLKLCAYD